MSDLISLDQEQAQKVANDFEQEAERIQRLFKTLQSDTDMLRKGGWIANAADLYYQKMDNEVMPGVNRLSQALMNAAQTTRQITQIFTQADEEASNVLRSE